KARHSYHGGTCRWPLLDGPLVRGVFDERVVHAVLMVVAYVVTFSFSTMTWSRSSRRQFPTHLSAVPFCQGDWMLVRFGVSPVAFKTGMTSWSNFASRSRIT